MNIQNLPLKFLIVVLIVAFALYCLYPPQKTLKPGIDLAGGSSLLYEIDTEGLQGAQLVDLSERIIQQLRKRVDPNNQRNLVWRPVGNTRIEIQMPAPSQKARDLRNAKDQSTDDVLDLNVSRSAILNALEHPEEQQEEALLALNDRLPAEATDLKNQRAELFSDLAGKFQTYNNVRNGLEEGDEAEARQAYDDALAAVMQTNLKRERLHDVLDLDPGPGRQQQIEKLKTQYPAYTGALDIALEQYKAWSSDRGSLEDPEDLKRLLRGQGVLEFRIMAQRDPSNASRLLATRPALAEQVSKYITQLAERGPRPKGRQNYQWFKIQDPAKFAKAESPEEVDTKIRQLGLVIEKYADDYYVLAFAGQDYGLLAKTESPWKLTNARPWTDQDTGKPIVLFSLDRRGGDQFYRLTKNNLEKPLGVFLDGECMSSARIANKIRERGQITGDFSTQDVSYLVQVLEAGSLPARLKEPPLSERSIGPSLGKSNIDRGLKAAILGLAAVAVFMLIYYLLSGAFANLALAMNIIFVLASMAVWEATFTLPGIAGLILTVGMAVDANVLIFERIREELKHGASLKMAVKNGYDKAFSTILDANITTLITCVILGYAGSEEVRGFAIVLGLGVVFSMFTALFVTRIIFAALIQGGILKSLKMLRFFAVPNVNWMSLRRTFWTVSIIVVGCGAAVFGYEQQFHKSNIYDIEFLGGTAVTIKLKDEHAGKLSDKDVRDLITGEGSGDSPTTATAWLRFAAERTPNIEIVPAAAGIFTLSHPDLNAQQLEMIVMTAMSGDIDLALREGAIMQEGTNSIRIATKSERNLDRAMVQQRLQDCRDYLLLAANRMNSAKVTIEWDALAERSDAPQTFEITTTETRKAVVRQAIVAALGDRLDIQRPINYDLRQNESRGNAEYFFMPGDRLSEAIGDGTMASLYDDLGEYQGGVVIVFEHLQPPHTATELHERLHSAKLLPEFEQFKYRPFEVLPLQFADEDRGKPTDQRPLSAFALLANDEDIIYDDDPQAWRDELAVPELERAKAALSSTKTLQKVTQFNPQIAGETTQQAIMAILLALVAIVIYIWLRFGNMQFGLAAIVALVHDVTISLGAVALSYYASKTALGQFLRISDFKIDLPMIAALLTIVGYSLNDSIVVFDRIRENRGKLKDITVQVTNQSINQTLSRTVLTSLTTLMAVGIMYVFGGQGIHGFSFAMIIGVLVGTYSSVAIAAPLVLHPKLLKWIINIIVALILVALALTLSQAEFRVLLWGVLAIFVLVVAVNEIRRLRAQRALPVRGTA